MVLVVYAVLLALTGFAASVLALIGGWGYAVAGALAIAFALGWVVYSWIANLVIPLSRK
jgi:hypothetical protein